MKTTGVLLILLLSLQYNLWIGNGSLARVSYLKNETQALGQKIEFLAERNQVIIADVLDLKHGNEAIEEYARNDLGMIKRSELFYQIVTLPAREE